MENRPNINEILLKAHELAVLKAIDDSERTGVSLVIYKDGKIVLEEPKYRYVREPISNSSDDE